jgi:DNA repair exonuclease SbcCD ATPase subunit
MKALLTIALTCVFAAGPLFAQAPSNTAAPVSQSSINELNQLISNLQSASQSAQESLSHLRIEKWKTDSNTKKQTQNDVESILRNLQNALPSILADLKNSPENLALTFKTYRNLDALYDVMNSVVESVGAFGSKEEFQSLNNDLGAVENSRRAFADRMDKLANTKETEIGQLRTALQTARAATPPKKVVVDDDQSAHPKKVPAKKKTVPKPKPSTTQGATPPAGSQNPSK